MDYESASSREMGAWNPKNDLAPFLEKWSVPNPDFVVDEVWRGMVAGLGFSGTVSQDILSFWDKTVKDVYSGEEGRKKLRMATINLMEMVLIVVSPTSSVRCTGCRAHKILSSLLLFRNNRSSSSPPRSKRL
jgi:hypothetical protein